MNEDFIRNRISTLRVKRGISEYKMSLDLGHSKSYVQSISSGRALPSMSEFLFICDYLGVSPKDFFDAGQEEPAQVGKLCSLARQLPAEDLAALIHVAQRLEDKKSIEKGLPH